MKLLFVVLLLLNYSAPRPQQSSGVVKATLNGLDIVFDAKSGGILQMAFPATGVMLQTTRDSAGMIDLAYPVKEFEPFRLATRFSENVRFTKTKNSVTIHWDELGGSRSFVRPEGKVSATVTVKEVADGQSISMSCKIVNNSNLAVPQIVFPDLSGFIPFCGREGTEFRTGTTMIKPFIDMLPPDNDNFYALNASNRWFHFGFVIDGKNPTIKWMDIGGRKGGLSMFTKNWGTNAGYNEGIYLRFSESAGTLRYMNTLNINIAPNETWQSAEFILTPHRYGWAKGIITYRNWAKQNVNRTYPVPDHVRDGLGFRSIWLKNFYPNDPEGVNFKFSDLPKVAKESKEHGLNELNLWGWYENLQLPLPPPYPILGTQDEMAKYVAECKQIGVNVAPFLTTMTAGAETAPRYGLADKLAGNSMYDPDFLPQMNPHYSTAGRRARIPNSDPLWQKDILASSKKLIDCGIASASWDEFFKVGDGHHLDSVVAEIRKMAKEKDPQSTFSGEAGTNMENEYNFLDYTWNWDYDDGYDYRALVSLLPAPRININIDKSVVETKLGFADNLYLNVWPRKPDGINGSDYISNHPELSSALKQCARLRKQFLKYFVDGIFIGDCVLSKNNNKVHVSAYVLPQSMLVIAINKNEKQDITLQCDIQPWLPSRTGTYKINEFRDGTLMKTSSVKQSQWLQKTPQMQKLDIWMYIVKPE